MATRLIAENEDELITVKLALDTWFDACQAAASDTDCPAEKESAEHEMSVVKTLIERWHLEALGPEVIG